MKFKCDAILLNKYGFSEFSVKNLFYYFDLIIIIA